MKKILLCGLLILDCLLCFAETYLLNNSEKTGDNIKFTYYYNDLDDVFSLKKTNWKSKENPVFVNYLILSKDQENTLLKTLDKYKEWEEKFDISACEEKIEKEIPDSKLIISKKEYHFFFVFDYKQGRRVYPELIVYTPNANGKLISSSYISNRTIAEIKQYFNRDYFNSNKESIIATQEKDLQYVKSQCDKANKLLEELDETLEANDFEKARKLVDNAEDCLYEPWRADPINLEYIYSVSTNPKELVTQQLLKKCSNSSTLIRDKKKKFDAEKANALLN